jgi:hypothetical protein
MWSQDELNNKLINAPEYGDDPKSFFRECGGFEYPCFELKDILQDSNVKLALVQWLLRQWNVSGLQLGHLLFYAAKNKHYDIVEFLENYAKEKGC